MRNRHILTSKVHRFSQRDIWWYAIPALGNKYREGDQVEFIIENYNNGQMGSFSICLEGIWLKRIKAAPSDMRGYVHVKIWRYITEKSCSIYFGDRSRGEWLVDIEFRENTKT